MAALRDATPTRRPLAALAAFALGLGALAHFTGAAHALAGVAILFGVLRTLAASLEALMTASFVVLVHVPRVLAHPYSRMEWTMLGVAVTLCGSAALVAAISDRHSKRR